MKGVVPVDLGDTPCALPLAAVRGVVRAAWPTPLARAPEWVLGGVTLSGVFHVVVDLSARLARAKPHLSPSDAWVRVDFGTPLGAGFLAVDAVLEDYPGDFEANAMGTVHLPGGFAGLVEPASLFEEAQARRLAALVREVGSARGGFDPRVPEAAP